MWAVLDYNKENSHLSRIESVEKYVKMEKAQRQVGNNYM